MKEYKVVQKTNSNVCYLINKITSMEGGTFFNHIDGVSIVSQMLVDKIITRKHALQLFIEIVTVDIPTCEIKDKRMILKERAEAINYLIAEQTSFEDLVICEKCLISGPKLVIFEDMVGFYGIIYAPEFKSESFESKDEGLFYLSRIYELNKINLLEKEQIQKEIWESNLPDIDEKTLASLN